MAGGFNGNDEDWSVYDPPELGDEEEQSESEETEENEESEPQSAEEVRALNKKQQYEAEEKRLSSSLPKIREKLDNRYVPHLQEEEKQDIKATAKHPKLFSEMGKTLKKFWTKILEFIRNHSTLILWGLIIAAAIFIGIPVIVTVATWPIKWLIWPDDDSTGGFGGGSGGGSGGSAAYGVTGKDFYGVRTVYEDEELARTGLLENYATIIDDSVEEVLTIEKTKTETVGSGADEKTITYKITVVVNLEIPKTEVEGEEPTEFDYSTFNEDTFKTNYADYYAILNSIAEEVYVADNPTGTVPETLIAKLDGIKYFGLDSAISEEVRTLIYNKLVAFYNVEVFNTTDNKAANEKAADFKTEFKTAIEGEIDSKISSVLSNHTNRAEKVFIKDFVFKSETAMMEGIQKQNYKTWIFMPKNSIQFEKISFYVNHTNFDNFDLKLFNNGSEINIKKDSEGIAGEGYSLYGYVADNIRVSADVFEDIDSNNLSALSSGVSLAAILSDTSINTDTYLILNSDGVYTYKQNGVYVNFESDESFQCVELETLWK